jgi:two-component system, NarL family, sensor histidine kinase DegS
LDQQLNTLAAELESEEQTLQRELDEIDLLLKQAASEVERNESRRVQAEERLAQIERDQSSPVEAIAEARAQVLSQTRRATLMQAQLDVLGGKQRALQRYRTRLETALPIVRAVATHESGGAQPRSGAPMSGATTGGSGYGAASDSGDVLAAQEQMRREIARQMHDGPAQSIANIALQAQVVQRLFERDPERANQELNELVAMVQQALEATKTFIFDVRPMVLDDLGLVPTLRRSAAERSRRWSVAVRFESVGTDRRLSTELESGLFRMIDDAVGAFINVHATSVLIRVDWSDHTVRATIGGSSPHADQTDEQRNHAVVAAARRDKNLPGALATMIHEQEEVEAARNHGLPENVRAEIEQRATALGVTVTVSDDRWMLELLANS